MTFEEFELGWQKSLEIKLSLLTNGQNLMQYLHEIWPTCYEKIKGNKYLDSSLGDNRIPSTLVYLKNHWNI